MRIDSSMVGMESVGRYKSSVKTSSRYLVKDEGQNTAQSVKDIHLRSNEENAVTEFRQQMVKYIIALLFGEERAKKIFDENVLKKAAPVTITRVVSYETQTIYQESQELSYRMHGLVKTEDGREINIGLEFQLSHNFTSYFSEEIEIAQISTSDPLVLNFSGSAAQLTDQKFFFDIDADGTQEKIARLMQGSGYLALDKNNDQKINDGSELFGPQSGSGFQDLATYDEDQNGWIDENDSVWDKLKIWCHNEDGTETLYTLSQKGVGAIYLGNVTTNFALKDAENSTQGIIRNTGIYLYENGTVGTLQHLDLANVKKPL